MSDTLTAPPQAHEAEQAVLGAILTGAPVLDDLESVLQGRDFYRPAHEAIWDACVAVHRRGERVDPILVARELGQDQLQRAGGAPYLHTLVSGVAIAANAGYYADQVLEAALRRRLQDAGTRVVQLAQQHEDATQAAEDARQVVDEASSQVRTQDAGLSVGDSLEAVVDWLETEPVGAETPWVDVNARTNGMLAGQLITVAARPGGGKSLALKDAGVHTAKVGKPVHIATLEMSRNEYMARVLSTEARVDLGKMLRRQLDDSDWQRVAEAMDRMRELPLYLDDRERQSMAQVRAAARQTQRKYGQQLGLIGIDYCQLVQPADRRVPREQQVAQISRDAKLMAKEFECPVLLLAQLNRRGSDRSDPTPMVTDLRESGALEQDSDQVWLLHRPDMYGDEDRLGEADLIVGKNRNGPAPVTIPLAFRGHYAHLASLA